MVRQEHNEDNTKHPFSDPLPDEVRVLMIGDRGVGKTSIVHSLVNDKFEPNLPPKLADVMLPAEIAPENIPMRIIDYSERDQASEFANLVLQADVICMVYSANDPKSFANVSTHWLPTVRNCQTMFHNKVTDREKRDEASIIYRPIILVANKIDLTNDNESSSASVTAVVNNHSNIEAYIRVSAFSQENIIELFTSAQKAVAYPLAPLFDPKTRTLTKECKSTLIDIFKICDMDGDNLLNDYEINAFQENCFGVPLQKYALDDLKLIIKQSTTDGIAHDAITQTGFLFLHILSIESGRHVFTWRVLRKFNHDNQVQSKIDHYGDQSTVLVSDLSDRRYSMMSLEERNLNDSTLSSTPSPSSSMSRSSVSSGHQVSIQQLNLSWLKEHSSLIKTGIGVTIATLSSMLVLKLVIQRGFRS